MEADWRRIDVDALDPENQQILNDLKPPVSLVSAEEVQAKISQIRQFTGRGDFASAISAATCEPPYGGDDASKHAYTLAVLEALSQVRQGDMGGIVSSLQQPQVDVLVSYLYKCMSIPEGQKQGGILLSWFEKATASGLGSIVRHLSDRRTL